MPPPPFAEFSFGKHCLVATTTSPKSCPFSSVCFVLWLKGAFGSVVLWLSCALAELCFGSVVLWPSCALPQLCFVSVVLWLLAQFR